MTEDLTRRARLERFGRLALRARGALGVLLDPPLIGSSILLTIAFASTSQARRADPPITTNSFPTVPEVLQGRAFESDFEREVFFLRSIHDRYASHWPELLAANVNEGEYIRSPSKLFRFVNEIGAAVRDKDDPFAITNLALIASSPGFYANTNGYYPEVLRAAAGALINMGPNGRKALASAFTENHYRSDPQSLEDLAEAVGTARPADPGLASALASAAFDFATTNGGCYPRCTRMLIENLLRLPDGASDIRPRLAAELAFKDPGRYQAVVDGIATARAVELGTELKRIEESATLKLATLTNSPGAYRDDLRLLDSRIREALGNFVEKGR